MFEAHSYYLLYPLNELERLVETHRLDFEELIKDTFADSELERYEGMLDSIAAVTPQPLISELTFEDFYVTEGHELKQRSFFEECRSSICIENLPDFHSNPFQVTYLIELLRNFEEVLIDKGGVHEIQFKKEYIEELKRHKNIFSLIPEEIKKPVEVSTSAPIDPIDFLILDVYKEIDRLRDAKRLPEVIQGISLLSDKAQKAFKAMVDDKFDASLLLRKSGLNAKDFDDNLERLKFYLKKII
jgi:hypothetical protein